MCHIKVYILQSTLALGTHSAANITTSRARGARISETRLRGGGRFQWPLWGDTNARIRRKGHVINNSKPFTENCQVCTPDNHPTHFPLTTKYSPSRSTFRLAVWNFELLRPWARRELSSGALRSGWQYWWRRHPETSVNFYQTIWRNIPDDCQILIRHRENLKTQATV
jgi:hypothetical protein